VAESLRGLRKMLVRYPVWDVSYDVAVIFTLGRSCSPFLHSSLVDGGLPREISDSTDIMKLCRIRRLGHQWLLRMAATAGPRLRVRR
jgi:hypothetical protein